MENNKEENFRLYGWGFSKYGQTGSLEFELTTNPIEIKNGNEQDSINLKSIFHITRIYTNCFRITIVDRYLI